MIYPDDSKSFSTLMDVTWQSLGRNYVDAQTKRYWFSKLQKYALGDVANAFDKWLLTTKELPTIGDILKLCIPKDDFYKAIGYVADEEIKKDGLNKIKQHIAEHTNKKPDYHAWFKRILANPSKYPDSSVSEARRVAREFGYNIAELERA